MLSLVMYIVAWFMAPKVMLLMLIATLLDMLMVYFIGRHLWLTKAAPRVISEE
jgi:hypothetical protein